MLKNIKSFGDKFLLCINLNEDDMLQTFWTKNSFLSTQHFYIKKMSFTIIFTFEKLKYLLPSFQ